MAASRRPRSDSHVSRRAPARYGNLATGALVMLLTYAFAAFVLRIVERLQAGALAQSRDVAALSAVVEERARLSRELHDGFAQLVAYLLVRLDTVTGLVTANRSEEALAELERMRGVTDDLYQDVRESISELRTQLSERSLAVSIRDYVDAYEDRHGVTVYLVGDDVAESLPALMGFQLLRIIQEALANVRKHARARNTWISFERLQGDRLEMVIRDDGRGFDPDSLPDDPPRKTFGLASMRERVESLGGRLHLDSQRGHGTRVVVSIPLSNGTGR